MFEDSGGDGFRVGGGIGEGGGGGREKQGGGDKGILDNRVSVEMWVQVHKQSQIARVIFILFNLYHPLTASYKLK